MKNKDWSIWTIIIVITLVGIITLISWGVTCGIVYLICKCFGWIWFSLARATGIWLILGLISGISVTAKPR